MWRLTVPTGVAAIAVWYLFTGGCTDPLLHIPSIDGFILNEPAGRSDVDLAAVLAQHDHDALMVYQSAGAVGPLKHVFGSDGIVYTFPPDAKAADVERTLLTLYPASIAHAMANNVPVKEMLPEDRLYMQMIAAGLSAGEAAQVRDTSISRVYRKAYAQSQEKLEREHQEALAKRKPLLTTSIAERIAEARNVQQSTCFSPTQRLRSSL